MADLTRRSILLGGVATLTALALPQQPIWTGVDLATGPDLTVAWRVGTEGEYNWQFIRGTDAADAIRAWVEETAGSFDCDDGGDAGSNGDCDCEACYAFAMASVQRAPEWDHYTYKNQPLPADWLRAGLGYICERCGEETSKDAGARIVTINQTEYERSARLYNRVGENVLCEDCHDKFQRDRFNADQARLADAAD